MRRNASPGQSRGAGEPPAGGPPDLVSRRPAISKVKHSTFLQAWGIVAGRSAGPRSRQGVWDGDGEAAPVATKRPEPRSVRPGETMALPTARGTAGTDGGRWRTRTAPSAL